MAVTRLCSEAAKYRAPFADDARWALGGPLHWRHTADPDAVQPRMSAKCNLPYEAKNTASMPSIAEVDHRGCGLRCLCRDIGETGVCAAQSVSRLGLDEGTQHADQCFPIGEVGVTATVATGLGGANSRDLISRRQLTGCLEIANGQIPLGINIG